MKSTKALLGVVGFGLLAAMANGCSSQQDEGDEDNGALTSGNGESKPGQWVVDLKKAASLYGTTTKHFLGYDGAELGGQQAGFPPGFILWDQSFHFGTDRKPIDAGKEFPLVKDASGKVYGPKGRWLNIIPLLKDTDPTKQFHLRKYLQNGDILEFFHPEYTDMRSAMDRRGSHVAMHYDYKSPYNGKEFIHHVDNPNNYGPRYNYTPSTHMPFHVFRYMPKGMDAKKASNYALAARNWSFITDDLSPFADFYTLNLQKHSDLQKFRDSALAGQQIPNVYCSGLAYTNLNLGINFPLKPSDIGDKKFGRAETGETLDKQVLAPSETADLASANRLVFESYTPSQLATVWLDNTYGHLPVQGRQQLARSPQTQGMIGQGFRALLWSDSDQKQPPSTGSPPAVANADNLKVWGEAYGLKAGDETAQFLARTDLKITGENGQSMSLQQALAANPNIDKNQPASKILADLEIAHVKTKFVPPRIWSDTAEDRFWDDASRDQRAESTADIVYIGTVLNCELLAAADGSDADACKLDVAGVGAGTDEFSQGGADSSTYAHYAVPNGGERTHRRFDARTGPTAMGKGSKIVVRATASDISDVKFLFHTPAMYADAANSTMYGAKWGEWGNLSSWDYDDACTRVYRDAQSASRHGSCAPMEGIVLDPATVGARGGAVGDTTYTFDLMKVCTVKDEKTMTCPVASQKADGSGWDMANVKMKDVNREIPHGEKPSFTSSTMVDVGAQTTGQQTNLCPACATGGAHFNQWTVTLRNDQ